MDKQRRGPTPREIIGCVDAMVRRIGVNVNQIAHNANREMNATIGDEASASYAVRQCRELVARLDSIIDQSGNG